MGVKLKHPNFSGAGTSEVDVENVKFEVSGDASLSTSYDAINDEFVVTYSATDTNTQSDDPIDLFVDGSNVDYNVEDLNLIGEAGSGISLQGISDNVSDSNDSEVKFSFNE